MDHGCDRTKIAVQQVDYRARCKLFANSREILDVGKENRKGATFGMFGPTIDQAVDDARVEKFAKCVFDTLPCVRISTGTVFCPDSMARVLATNCRKPLTT